jgi:DNA-binding Xre family transcriptional regulator
MFCLTGKEQGYMLRKLNHSPKPCLMPSSHITLKIIGHNIKKIRLANRIKQEWLARKVRLSVSEISRLENGKRDTSVKKLLAIAEAMHCHPAELFNSE